MFWPVDIFSGDFFLLAEAEEYSHLLLISDSFTVLAAREKKKNSPSDVCIAFGESWEGLK